MKTLLSLLFGSLYACSALAAPTITSSESAMSGSATTAHAVTYPVCPVGSTLLLLTTTPSASVNVTPAGPSFYWTQRAGVNHSGPQIRVMVFTAVVDGTEPGTLNIATSSAVEMAAWVGCVEGMYGQYIRVVAALSPMGSCLPMQPCTPYMNTAPNPPNLNPNTWGIEDTLWIEVVGHRGNAQTTAYSVNYDDNQFDGSTGGTTGPGLTIASRAAAVEQENPGVLTLVDAKPWIALTVAIRPSP